MPHVFGVQVQDSAADGPGLRDTHVAVSREIGSASVTTKVAWGIHTYPLRIARRCPAFVHVYALKRGVQLVPRKAGACEAPREIQTALAFAEIRREGTLVDVQAFSLNFAMDVTFLAELAMEAPFCIGALCVLRARLLEQTFVDVAALGDRVIPHVAFVTASAVISTILVGAVAPRPANRQIQTLVYIYACRVLSLEAKSVGTSSASKGPWQIGTVYERVAPPSVGEALVNVSARVADLFVPLGAFPALSAAVHHHTRSVHTGRRTKVDFLTEGAIGHVHVSVWAGETLE